MNEERGTLFVLGSFMAACCATVDTLPRPGETVRATGFTLEPGGKGFNVAVAARRLGAEVDCLMAIGDDVFGAMAAPALARNGLSSTHLRRYPTPNGAGIGLIQGNGENCVAVFPGANASLSAADVQGAKGLVRRAAMVIAQFEISDAPIATAFAIARSAGRLTLLNPSPFRPIAADILANTTILIVNESEALDLAAMRGVRIGRDRSSSLWIDLATSLQTGGVELLIVTLGANGAIAVKRDGTVLRQEAFPVDAIDTLGAGDAFTAAFAVLLMERGSLADAMRYGAANGALTASRRGTIDALPSRAALDAFPPNEAA